METLDYTINERGEKDTPLTREEAKEFCRQWDMLRQYPRRAIDIAERAEDQKLRHLSINERAVRDSVDPCLACICTKYMKPGYCDRPCRAKIRHTAFEKWREASGN